MQSQNARTHDRERKQAIANEHNTTSVSFRSPIHSSFASPAGSFPPPPPDTPNPATHPGKYHTAPQHPPTDNVPSTSPRFAPTHGASQDLRATITASVHLHTRGAAPTRERPDPINPPPPSVPFLPFILLPSTV